MLKGKMAKAMIRICLKHKMMKGEQSMFRTFPNPGTDADDANTEATQLEEIRGG